MIVTLGKTSKRRLATCHPVIQKLVSESASDPECPCDFGVVCGYRGKGGQELAYANNRSKAKWGESDHNVKIGDIPYSLAVDLAPYDPEKRDYVWNSTDPRYEALASHLMSKAESLGYKLEWGGNYTSISDKPHYSLKF